MTVRMSGGDLLVLGASEIVTLAGGLRRGRTQDDVAVLRRSEVGALALAVVGGRVRSVGSEPDVLRWLHDHARLDLPEYDAAGGTITPGLVDPHTHLLFGGTREGELGLRQGGADYLDILSAGGGILATVDRTRAATDDQLLRHGRRWLAEMLSHGVTTVEVKSGYGLDVDSELRLLDIYGRLADDGPIELVPTFLGAHAVPREYLDGPDASAAYARDVVERQLPRVADQGIARFCDVFCERGVFDVEASRRVLEAARALGLKVRLHADELDDSGGAVLAAELGATSADHLGALTQPGMDALGRVADDGRPVVATLLPATTLYLMKERHAPARALIDRGVPVALGTDFNPGTSPTANLGLVMSLACIELRMTPAEVLSAVTINAAHAVGLGETHGALEAGRVGDLVVWAVPRHDLVAYWLGADLVQAVVKAGRVVAERPIAI